VPRDARAVQQAAGPVHAAQMPGAPRRLSTEGSFDALRRHARNHNLKLTEPPSP
jgi:hypothetical protein